MFAWICSAQVFEKITEPFLKMKDFCDAFLKIRFVQKAWGGLMNHCFVSPQYENL